MSPTALMNFGNGGSRELHHDTDYRLTDIVTDLKVGYHYDFDANNRVTGFTNFAEGAWSHTFGYDALNRLTAANSPGLGNQSFGYDAGSNRKTHNASAYTIATGSNRLMAEGGRSYTYTPTGNVKTITGYGIGGGDPIFANGFEHAPLPVTTYSYDGMDRLVGAAGPGFVAGYQIGPDGTRIRKTANGETTRFVYGPGGMLLSEHRHTPARWTHYLWLNGEPVALVRNNTLYWIQTDHLGRPEGITNSNKQRVWRANLRAFDRRVIDDDIGGFHLGFPGQYHDTETGHAYNVHRDYHPATGRYLQSDPIGLAGGLNTYAYAGSNPANLIDPLGLDVCLESADSNKAPFGLHLRVAVYSESGNFIYGQSFGASGLLYGIVYDDSVKETREKKACTTTTNKQNAEIMRFMRSELSTPPSRYSTTGAFGTNCRTYSRDLYTRIVDKLEGEGE